MIQEQEDREAPEYQSEDCRNLLNIYADFYPKTGFQPPWTGYFVLRENEIVGSCGFAGSPQNGEVELAYWTFKAYEGQGIASAACEELMVLALEFDPTLTLTAKTEPRHNSSTKILQKNGFEWHSVVQDEEIGNAWLWKRLP